jgi:benzodiazapine receptor
MIVKKVKVRVKNKNNYLILLAFVILVQLAGGIGAYFTTPNIPIWYESLNKPSFTPPNWIFGPVWTLLYLLMGISAYQVWSKGWEKPDVKSGLYIFLIQLVLNILWSVTFFDIRSPKGAFVVILFLK